MGHFKQHPEPGGHTLHFRGDTVTFTLTAPSGATGRAWLRTNIGHARIRHREIILHAEEGLPPLSRDWHDYPMESTDKRTFNLTLPLTEVGRFEAKAFFISDGSDVIEWPSGANSVLKVEPAETCAGNTMYTAFVRLFGEARYKGAVAPQEEPAVQQLDDAGYAVIPRSGTFRDLIKELDFIVGTLRCHIVQLLPIHPTPTTYARMGRFGSPFAVMDLLNADPALAEFDQHTTPMDQFEELVDEVHRRNARLYLDMPINHTGWASHLQVNHPEWFHHNEDGSFMSPGAWGVTWEDLSKLDYSQRGLWRYMAKVFLFWCRRGVDGFRCDAGYKVPFEAWEYIIAKVRMEYPDTIFMLEGLGGYKHITENLLANAGMNWAYSEIFQNYDQGQVDSYLPESLRVSESKGNLIHFCETHDNLRLAATSQTFAQLRAAFCALTSHNGAFGFTNGVEWYAEEKINVHNAHSLNWGAEPNMIGFLQRLHGIMEVHPAFHPGSKVEIITDGYHNSAAVLRTDVSGSHRLLVVANFNHEGDGLVAWHGDLNAFTTDLLSGTTVTLQGNTLPLHAGQVCCLSNEPEWSEDIEAILATPFFGAEVAEQQRIRAKVMEVVQQFDSHHAVDFSQLIESPKALCESLAGGCPIVTSWQWPRDTRREVLLPPDHCLLVRAPHAFMAELKADDGETLAHEKSIIQSDGHAFALFMPLPVPERHRHLKLCLRLFEPAGTRHTESAVLLLSEAERARVITTCRAGETQDRNRFAVCTNHHGALAQVRIGWAEIRSKYDGILCANLHDAVPVDRHTLFTRCRVWVVHRDYSNELSLHCQKRFSVTDDGAVVWNFAVPVGEGKLIPLKASLQLHPDTNAVQLSFLREAAGNDPEHLEDDAPVALIIRPDIEDRCNHEVTKAFTGPEEQWPAAVKPASDGFTFAPAAKRKLKMVLKGGSFTSEPEWYYMIEHPVDQSRGIDGSSDLFSPGWFRIELKGKACAQLKAGVGNLPKFGQSTLQPESETLDIETAMQAAMRQFIVKRDEYQTVIAGYPWFLDWGRDTLICLRGIIAAGLLQEAENILLQFARFEKGGTIPNMIRGNDDNNRETSDAPLWFFVGCDELMQAQGGRQLLKADCAGRSLKEVLISIARGYLNGTENGICVDPETALVYSPSHYTWMDTNYPAGTPREGYPIEIQAMWHYALKLLAELEPKGDWEGLAETVRDSIRELFVIEADDFTYLADCLAATPDTPAREAEADDALRSNQLLAITLGAVQDQTLGRKILEACEQLLIPGAIRSLADRPVEHPLPVYNEGTLLNDPQHPYWGRYEGDEDTLRKPAYHNGTAWTWPFPSYAEAMVQLYGSESTRSARAILASATEVINRGCLRQTPEVIDGNSPHTQRGCGAQAWGVTELYRVSKKLKS